ncbi:MAG: universal stress protein [Betaproteobacteria bacterium]
MYSRILVPIDGSATSDRGLTEAIKLAQDQKARLRVLHVVDEPFFIYDMAGYRSDIKDAMREGGADLVARAEAAAAAQGVEVETEVVDAGSQAVADRILADAKEWEADLIVMGTHGRRGFATRVLGSDAQAVLHGFAAPVLLVKARGAPG